MLLKTLLLTLGLALFACSSGGGGSGGGDSGDPPDNLALEPAFGGLAFVQPVKLVQHPTDANRWYVVEKGGKIFTFLASNPAGTLELALDLVAARGINLGSGEQGLLGLAFDPDFNNGGELYIAYTDNGLHQEILARYTSADVDGPFVPASQSIVLAIPHPESFHNGGDIMFGADDFLYYSLGDGGDSFNGQREMALLGKVLRIDVLGPPASGEKYAIPNSNPFQTVPSRPFCDSGVSPADPMQPCPEVYAFGFRNPWRMHFDPETDQLWLGDVGEERREEIDLVVSGGNYGWPCVEGDLDGPASCVAFNNIPPEAVHDRDDAHAITGGAVYRGSAIPGLQGFYVYGDFITGKFFAFHIDDMVSAPTRLGSLANKSVAAFGQGRDGEIYVVTFDTPSIYKIVRP
jgi:glucose/arabinose dehydrogenase